MHLFSFLFLMGVATLGCTSEPAPTGGGPHLTGCVSPEMVTFRCWWSVGAFLNVSRPGDLRLFYLKLPRPVGRGPEQKPTPPPAEDWRECPHYSTERPRECFFDANHTAAWTEYKVQLRSRDAGVVYDRRVVYVDDIVHPDPPTGLNWTLLNMSSTGVHYDIMLRWKPPASADVEVGWITLQYQVQHRDVRSDQWTTTDLVNVPHRSLFGFQTNTNHEVRVRCKQLGEDRFGEFSDSVFIDVPSKGPRFPLMALLVFGALCLVAVLMLVLISQQDKLMVILLPPVPGPKIRGIDPELLKKGKLRELTSILGVVPDLRPELYDSDSWVEFIDLDLEEPSDRLTILATDPLDDRAISSDGSPLSIDFGDDESGRASCCDADLPGNQEASLFQPFFPPLSKDVSYSTDSDAQVQDPGTDGVPPGRDALYAQVSEVRWSGKVLLSPEEHKEKHPKEDKELQFRAVTADQKDYTAEESGQGLTASPHRGSENVSSPVYTVVEGVDGHNSLLLTPNPKPASRLMIPKNIPTPNGYLTPDQLGSITP